MLADDWRAGWAATLDAVDPRYASLRAFVEAAKGAADNGLALIFYGD